MDDSLAMIVTSLQCIQEEDEEGNFSVFIADAEKNYYIQFAAEDDRRPLHAEAVSNDFLAPEFALSIDQIAQLQSTGWNPPSPSASPNFYRESEATNDDERLLIPHEAMRSFC